MGTYTIEYLRKEGSKSARHESTNAREVQEHVQHEAREAR